MLIMPQRTFSFLHIRGCKVTWHHPKIAEHTLLSAVVLSFLHILTFYICRYPFRFVVWYL